MSFIKKIFGSRNDRFIKSVEPIVMKVNSYEAHFQQMDDEELKSMTDSFKNRLKGGETLDDLLPEAYAVVREASLRSLGLRPYDVQVIGGIIQHRGKVTEMKTGEGKTLVATMPAYLNALMGKGVHVVTVNDYLAKRDAEWMAEVFKFLGMTCGYVIGGSSADDRRAAYASDITYVTNNELGFDHLRDNMAYTVEQRTGRTPYFAIIDEVDSILIDEARTPLIISGPADDKTDLYQVVDKLIPQLELEKDYEVDEKGKSATLTDEGTDRAEELLRDMDLIKEGDSLYSMEYVMLVHHINQALRAHNCFIKDVDYLLHEGKVALVDEFTGRIMAGRRLSDGLHQAIEAKEGVEIQTENQTLASITYQNYFRMYEKLAGMTGTADTEAEELESIYGLEVLVVPTHVDVARIDDADIIYRTVEEKDNAIVRDIRECYERGQPILVGTASIERSEHYSALLKKHKVKHEILNARHHEREAEIIAQAGRLGAVTIATNMAGRGTDIKLGGNLGLLQKDVTKEIELQSIAETYEREKQDVLTLGGLRVLGTERNESRRVDNQLRGRSGRQGDPGSSVFYMSLQDNLMRIFGKLDAIMGHLEMPKDEAIQSRLVGKAIETAQRKIETRNFEMRKSLLKYDDVLNDQRKVLYEQRFEVMDSDAVDDIILNFREESLEASHALNLPHGTYAEQWNVDGYKEDILRLFDVQPDIDKWVKSGSSADEVYIQSKNFVENVWIEKEKRLGSDIMRHLEKALLLQVLDNQWKEHLQRLDFLRQGIHLRGYGQKDPLQEYKKEAFSMFDGMLNGIRDQAVTLLSRVEVSKDDHEAFIDDAQKPAEFCAEGADYGDMNTGRNEKCPCGSGRKFKHCHGKLNSEQRKSA
ncbi:MAG: preprotein translocase subunit SecA [Alphaproteobacteria bacterium]|jgi:preprotein translocase subunit SecA